MIYYEKLKYEKAETRFINDKNIEFILKYHKNNVTIQDIPS